MTNAIDPAATDPAATVELLHIGGPTVRFRYGGHTWLTDPTFDEPGVYPGPVTLRKLTGPAVSADRIGPVDVVLLSHDQHPDNLDRTGRDFLSRVETTLSTPDAAERIEGVRGLENWESVRLGEVTVTGVPALHGPEGCEPVTGVVTGFVLRAEGLPTVYVSGDNASVERVERIVERMGRIDVAILNVGAANPGRFGDTDVTLNGRSAVRAAEALGDAVIVPVHAEGWAHFSETLDYLARNFEYAGRGEQLRIPVPGESLTVTAP
ncbi:metal-dependent hydrolase [Nocardia otitidiscaviarum]|uniref:Metal-dependent hydrolase n=1 Tax=Nocardia otitidiscaviarum TaxID=1823 RepID=A0A379JGC8_9NOCA|nr:MBL fold metallo-hydrolase [Nocardia otitidiscaviarum]SUD47520.1 metal-dependent hydrolase [Nocardia otitidiscaviarum]